MNVGALSSCGPSSPSFKVINVMVTFPLKQYTYFFSCESRNSSSSYFCIMSLNIAFLCMLGGHIEPTFCHHCTSTTSLEDCSKQQQSRQCPTGWNKCGILETPHQGKTSYLKGCFTTQLCQQFCAGGPNDVIGLECELSCCGKNMCN